MFSLKSKIVILFLSLYIQCLLCQEAREYNFITYAGSTKGFTDGDADKATFWAPEGIAVDAQENIYITEYRTSIVRKINSKGQVSVLAGIPNTTGFKDGIGKEALFDRPHGVTVDAIGNVYVCDMKNHCIRKISPDGVVYTIAGVPTKKGTKNGSALSAMFNQPEGIVINSRGFIYVADTYNFSVREITPTGQVSTFAGKSGSRGYKDGNGEKARFNMPIGIGIDKNDVLYIVDAIYDGTDAGNNLIRKISTDGHVSTFAGKHGTLGNIDGSLHEALFNRPVGIAVANNGTVYVADTEADVIRKIDTLGYVRTIGGTYLEESFKDGIGEQAHFADPQAIAVNSKGELYIADTFNHRIRKGFLVNNKPIRVFILAGQSNMYGRGDGRKLSKEELSDLNMAKNQIVFANNKTYKGPLQLSEVEPFGRDKFGITLGFGPELFFGLALSKKYPDDQFLFIKRAVGGTSLYGAWNPDWSSDKAAITNESKVPKLYSDLMAYIKEILSQYQEHEYMIEAILWVQGEADSAVKKNGSKPADTYGDNLQNLIATTRRNLNKPKLPFIFFQVGSGEVVNGMLTAEKLLENVIMIRQNENINSTDYYEKHPPPLGHYNYNGMKKLGYRFAEEFIKNFGQ